MTWKPSGGGFAGSGELVKRCCSAAYQSEAAIWLLGDSFHPGGLATTARLGDALELSPGMRVLDLACGRGASALFLAERYQCELVGVDLSERNIEEARRDAKARGLASIASFELCDGERTPFGDASFDAVICECAFCLFPDKAAAAREIVRLLKSHGRLGLSDLVRPQAPSAAFGSLAAWIACVGDAQSTDALVSIFTAAGMARERVETCPEALTSFIDDVRRRLFGAEILVGLRRLSWPGFDFKAANDLARRARDAAEQGALSYALLVMRKAAAAL